MLGACALRAVRQTLIAGVVVVSVAVLSAQTVVDPQTVQFIPSPDHNTAYVQSYQLSLYQAGGEQPFETVNLGKPAPVGGVIRVDFIALLSAVPPPNVQYEARVIAVGSGGSAASAPSNGFSFSSACSPSINPVSRTFTSAAGTGSVAVSVGAGCVWGAVSNASWLSITGGTTGSGNGTVNFSVNVNNSSTQRTGTLTIAGQTFTVTQSGAPCTYAIAPASQTVAAAGGGGSFAMTAPSGCTWSASTTTGWITPSGSGNGNGTVTFTAAANGSTTPRSGTISAGGQTFTVNQAAAPCNFAIAPGSQSVPATGGSGSFSMSAAGTCSWTASTTAGWISITGGASGTGAGTVSFSATANPTSSQRSGTIAVGGQTFTVNQAAAPCAYSVAPTSQSVASGGGTGTAAVTSLSGCTWTATSSSAWIGVTSGASGNGNGSVGFSVQANVQTSPRSGSLTIAGQTFTVNQAAAPCIYSIAPASQSVGSSGGAGSFAMTAGNGCSWTATPGAGWLSIVSGGTGSGNGTISFSAASNPNTSTRSASITVAGQTFTVNQAAAPCTYSIAPTSQAVPATGGAGSIAMTAASGCSWTATPSAAWITITGGSGGTGGGTIDFTAALNPSTSGRSGTIIAGGRTFSISQAGTICTYAISPNSQAIAFGGGSGATNVTSLTGCAWTATSAVPWITVTSGATGSGSGGVAFTVQANTDTVSRGGTLTIAGQTFTVNQAAAPCSYAIAPGSRSIGASGGAGSFAMTAGTGCSWTAATSAGWLSIVSGGSGTGNGTISYSAAPNPNPSARQGTVTVGGRTFTVDQAAAPCSFAIAPSSRTVAATGGTGSFDMTAATGCTWSAVTGSPWITITGGGSGNGGGTISFSAASNPGPSQRTGTITAGGETFSVNQPGTPCSYTLSPTSQSVTATGGNGSASVASATGCSWTASSAVPWISVTGSATGNGNGGVNFSVQANTETSGRSGTLTIAGQTFSVTQAGAPCSYAMAPTSQTVAQAGDSGLFTITAPTGCAWTASTGVGWITLTGGAGGTGSGPVSFNVATNAGSSQRTATIVAGGQSFTVTQPGVPTCTYSITPTSRTMSNAGGSHSVSVTTQPGCTWTAGVNDTWLTIVAGSSGTGNGSVTYGGARNTGAARTGTITVAGQTFTINQNGATCSYALSSASATFNAGSGGGEFHVITDFGCSWTATTTAPWMTLSNATGSSAGTVRITVAPNTGARRSANVNVNTRILRVSQLSAAPPAPPANMRIVTGSGGGGQ